MSENNTPEENNESMSLEDLADRANVTINQFMEKKDDPKVRRIATSVFGVSASLYLTYWASKRGARAAMKDYVKVGETAISIAATHADRAAEYAAVAEDNAKASHLLIGAVSGQVAELTKKIKKI